MNSPSADSADSAGSMGRGVLHAAAAATRFTLNRYPPPPDLAPFVDFYWVIRWDVRGEPAHEQAILPHPNVNLAFEASGADVHGVDTKIFTRSITGHGKALGVRFLPGGFRPFHSGPVSGLNDRIVPAAEILGRAADRARAAAMAGDADDAAMVEAAAGLLRGCEPKADPLVAQAADLVRRITEDPELRRVGQLARLSGLSERRLQRLFADYVGVPPKWVMRRARLHEAALRAEAEGPGSVDWAALAADLGYADQSHLTRDFTATLGVPPTRYEPTGY